MMRPILISVTVLVIGAALTVTGVADKGTPSPAATPIDCPVTQPAGPQPPEIADLGRMDGLGNDALWVSLVMWSEQPGIVPVPDDPHLQSDGRVIEMKWGRYRYATGTLTIEGHRLDAPAPPLEADVPDWYGRSGFQVSGLTFPTDGCWQVTGHLGADSLTIVLDVIYPPGFVPVQTSPGEATPYDCPVTQPNGIQPPASATVFGRGNGDYGNHYLWTSLWIWGEGIIAVPNDDHLDRDGVVFGMKWSWYRFVEGTLEIEGHRLDAEALPLEAVIPTGYGDNGFQVSGITFPTDGCWVIVGSIPGKGSLTFVVRVVYPPGFVPAATPTDQATLKVPVST